MLDMACLHLTRQTNFAHVSYLYVARDAIEAGRNAALIYTGLSWCSSSSAIAFHALYLRLPVES